MKTSTASAILAFAASSQALPSPVAKRQMLSNFNDADVLNYALTLEHLEDTFYHQGLANFTEAQFADAGFDSTFYKNLQEVAYDEATHVSFLTTALKAAGAMPVAACTYSFGVTSVDTFIATARIFEGIGVSAYLGAAKQIMNKDYLTAAASILTVEARHTAFFSEALGQSPFPNPFDVPLTPDEVYTMANNFIVSCPADNPTFPIKAFPDITVTSTGNVTAGSKVMFETMLPEDCEEDKLYAAFIGATGAIWAPLKSEGHGKFEVTVPEGVNGQSYFVLTKCNDGVTDDNVVAGPTFLEIMNPYPTMMADDKDM